MPNTFFQFKQFRVEQDSCAMKVSTDACLLGAFLAKRIPIDAKVLDIGSGTGLLALMIAQQHKGNIDAIELQPECFAQLGNNLANSPWHERLTAIRGDIRQYKTSEPYGFIITNPPFYQGDLPSPSDKKNIAMHSTELSLEELIGAIDRLLSPNGQFGLLLPYHRSGHFEAMAAKRNFILVEKLSVRQTPAHGFFRSILCFSRQRVAEFSESALNIRQDPTIYSEEFSALLRDYYLYL